jgi:formiminotetrahydrofolate cyclodeaminase
VYTWEEPYLEAVKETDDTKMTLHLLEAVASIKQRLLSPIDEESEEFRAILNARLGIEALKRERCAPTN